MIGSETFIIVAFMCSENSTPRSLASATCSARNERNAETLITVESITSPASSGNSDFSTVTVPSEPTYSIRTSAGAATVTDCSFDAKSPDSIVATWVCESLDHAPIECGLLRAYSLTALGARRSEFPWRSTGLTADPSVTLYFVRISSSSGVCGSLGKSGRS